MDETSSHQSINTSNPTGTTAIVTPSTIASANINSTAVATTAVSTTPTNSNNLRPAIGAAGAMVAITIGATMIVCLVVVAWKKRQKKKKSSVELNKSEKKEGYINALYDGESVIVSSNREGFAYLM